MKHNLLNRGSMRMVTGALLFLTAPIADAADPAAADRNSPEARILSEIHEANQVKIEAGELARLKGQTEEIRRFGEQVARDHRAADSEVVSVARRQGIELSDASKNAVGMPQQSQSANLSREHRSLLDKLRSAQGNDFDREFTKAMLDGHRETIEKLTQASIEVTNQEVRRLVTKTLPTLHKHHEEAQRLQQQSS
ncbi:MAG: DUF4142 domain-containing protein [Candidatus Omnitrophica bacterium]|nr:DUF4142 domain-containing protein [Candidatus Omnitrophota bacterium]